MTPRGTQRIAVVTGAGTGIGRVTARALLAAGHAVALAGRTAETLHEAADDHQDALAMPTDVTDQAAVERLFAAVLQRWGRVDLLVNNAGSFGPGGTIDQISVESWRSTLDGNLTGYLICARAAFAAMRAQRPQGGRIINNGSISAHVPRPGSAAYTSSKHAITGLTKALSLDGRAYGIACGQIDIGNAASALTADLTAGAKQADGSILAEPSFDARHAADAVVFMAGLPLEVNVQFMTIVATTMPYIGRG